MLQTTNKTPFITGLYLLPDIEGIDTVYLAIKATFTIKPEGVEAAEKQLPIIQSDEYWGDPGSSSLKYASEKIPLKPATDIVMLGNAYTPGGKATKVTDVILKVGHYGKRVYVFGDRFWKTSFGTSKITDPIPFTEMPLQYEFFFGGKDVHKSKGTHMEIEERNPVGAGFKMKKGEKKLDGLKLPNIEDPSQLISNWKDRPPPAGFGYIAPNWEPRKRYAGTYDEKWQKKRAPYLPDDFDPKFFNAAHPDFITDTYLQGGESVEIKNASKRGNIAFRLPCIRFNTTFFIDGEKRTDQPNLDTLILEPNEDRFSIIWRASQRCDKKALKVQEVRVNCLESDILFNEKG